MQDEVKIRGERRKEAKDRVKKFRENMTTGLAAISQSNEGLQLLRFLMYESHFLSPLTHETPEGVNKDVLLMAEAKRRTYLELRKYMDRETVMRVEIPFHEPKTKGGEDELFN